MKYGMKQRQKDYSIIRKEGVFSPSFWLFFISAIIFSACGEDDKQEIDQQQVSNKYLVSVGNTLHFDRTAMVKKLTDMDFGQFSSYIPSDKEISMNVVDYLTKDPQGKEVTASGIITYPSDKQIKGVVVSMHYTITKGNEAPSVALFTPESLLAFRGYLIISPDYIGFGSTSNLTHPYLHVENTGRITVDMVYAVREYLSSMNIEVKKNLIVMGYSQGGAAALAFQKMAEEQYADDMPIDRVFAGGGPYDLVATFNEFAQTNTSAYPCSIPDILIGLNYGDNLQLDFSTLFKEPLLSHYDDWYNSKNYTTGQINSMIGSNKISDFLNEKLFTLENSTYVKIYNSLEKNSLTNWTPKAPIYMIHAANDHYVPYVNALNAYNAFKKKGCQVELVTTQLDHGGTAFPYALKILQEL